MDEQQSNLDKFQNDLADLINKYSLENDSDTPDFLLAAYLRHCLDTWNVIQTFEVGNYEEVDYGEWKKC